MFSFFKKWMAQRNEVEWEPLILYAYGDFPCDSQNAASLTGRYTVQSLSYEDLWNQPRYCRIATDLLCDICKPYQVLLSVNCSNTTPDNWFSREFIVNTYAQMPDMRMICGDEKRLVFADAGMSREMLQTIFDGVLLREENTFSISLFQSLPDKTALLPWSEEGLEDMDGWCGTISFENPLANELQFYVKNEVLPSEAIVSALRKICDDHHVELRFEDRKTDDLA